MEDIGNGFLLESGMGRILLENGIDNVLMLESSQNPLGSEIALENYLFVKVGDGMSTGEKIR